MRVGDVVLVVVVMAADVACDAAPQCHGVSAIVLRVGEACVSRGAFGSCAASVDTSACTNVACCVQPDDPSTIYGAPCACPEDLRACTADESQQFQRALSRPCSGPADASADAAADAIDATDATDANESAADADAEADEDADSADGD